MTHIRIRGPKMGPLRIYYDRYISAEYLLA